MAGMLIKSIFQKKGFIEHYLGGVFLIFVHEKWIPLCEVFIKAEKNSRIQKNSISWNILV